MLRVFKQKHAMTIKNTFRCIHSYPNTTPKITAMSYIRPLTFGIATSTTCFFVGAYIHEREQETFWKKLKQLETPNWSQLLNLIKDDQLVLYDLWQEKKKLWTERKQQILQTIRGRLETYQFLPVELKRAILSVTLTLLSMSEAEKTMAGLISINVAVFMAWRVPQLQRFLTKYFATTSNNISMITSCFSHRQLFHLTLNMIALWSFGPWLHDVLGREQFVALYLSLGVGANVISHLAQLALRRPSTALGASGALYGLLSGTAALYPQAIVFIAFLPSLPIRISYAIPALISLDLAGIVLRWRMFDHFAHLGGAALGVAYMQFGPNHMWPFLLQTIRDLKKSGRGNGNGGGDRTSGVLMEMPNKLRIKLLGKKAVVPEEQ